MGLFDGLTGALPGGLGGLLGGESGQQGAGALGGESGQQGAGALGGVLDQHGGIGGLVEAFEKNGLGGVAQSWVAGGENLPVSPAQISQVLGSGPIAEFAQKMGIDPQEAEGHLSQLLPQLVDHLTPNGEVQGGAVGALEGLLSKFRGS